MLEYLLGNSWVCYKFTKVEFVDVTDLSLELEEMNKEVDNFDWDNKTFEEYEVLSDKINELHNKVHPHYFCSIPVDKTI